MESQPSLDAVFAAVETLYHSPTDKEKASQWLADLQSSVFAWKVADEMLREKRNLESCYFAAQTMRKKIQTSYSELPPEAYCSLRDSILDHLDQVNEHTNTVIITQLSLAIATLALQMSQWQNPVIELMQRYSERSPFLLLEIMTVLPEEIHSRPLRLGENRRKQVIINLTACAPTVSSFLKLCVLNSSDSSQIHVGALKCFASWVSIGAIDLRDTPEIISHVFTVLANTHSAPVHEAGTECVCTIMQALETATERMVLGQQLFAGVVSLQETYHMSVAHENTERSLNYCRIFTELAETFLEDIVRSQQNNETHYAIKVFDLVLMCVGHHDYEVAGITFNLWCRLSEDLYKKNNDTLTLAFKPYVERLIASLCRHSRIEPDHEGLLDEKEDFADFRVKVFELIKDVVFIVGSANCFRQMFIDLQNPAVTWDASEAALFVMQAVAKNTLPDENEVVPKVVEAILNIPGHTHVAVRHTSILLLGELCEWIDHHPQSLDPVLNYLLCGLQQPLLATAAATALTPICIACRRGMVPHIDGLVQVVQALDTLNIKEDAASGLLKGVVAVLSSLPTNQLPLVLRKICEVQIAPLVQLTKNDHPIERGKRSDPVVWLDRLSMILRHIDITQVQKEVNQCASIIADMWAVLTTVCDKYRSENRVVEHWCRCVRFSVRCLGKHSATLLHPIVKQIITHYGGHPHSSFLYLGSVLVDECARVPQCVTELLEMLGELIQPTFNLLQVQETNGLKNHPDTVEDFFRLCTRFLQRLPFAFVQCPAMSSILECALMSCSLDHRDANAAVMQFFQDLISSEKNSQSETYREARAVVACIMQQIGKRLVNNLIQASIFSLHSYLLGNVTDVLWELLRHDHVKSMEWLQEALSALPTHNSGGVMTATQKQLEQFYASVNSARSYKEVNLLLREFARLYR